MKGGAILSSSFAVILGQECVVANGYGIPMEAPSMGVGMVGVDYKVNPPWINHGDNGMVAQVATTNETQPNMGGQVEMKDPN